MKKILVILLISCLSISLVSCKKDTVEEPAATTAATTVATITTKAPTPVVEVVPGVPISGVRPIVVAIDNQGEICFPQAGLGDAEIVYELVVEGGITRYLAMFWDTSEGLVGPIRSARSYMLDFIIPYEGVFVHNGGSPLAKDEILYGEKVDYVDGITNANSIFFDITSNPQNWQDTFTNLDDIFSFIEKEKYETIIDTDTLPIYSKELYELEKGISASIVNINYSTTSFCSYMFLEEDNVYIRNRNGESHTDKNTNEVISVMNVIIQKVETKTIDDEGRQELTTIGSGSGFFITNGNCIEISWEKESEESKTIYKDADGDEIVLNPGNTWIQVIPTDVNCIVF